ncbi:MAG: FtsX-like permease family protein [Candidatus Dormibacteria bacterium]
MNQLRLLARALRWRAGAAAALLVVATVAVVAAAAGPLYLDTANDSVLHSVLTSNSVESNGITVIPQYSPTTPGSSVERAQLALRAAPRDGLYRWYAQGKMVLDAGVTMTARSGISYASNLISDPGQCGALHFTSGRCPTAPDEVALTARSAAALGVHLDSLLTVTPAHGGRAVGLKVVGIAALADPTGPFWFGAGPGYLDFGPAIGCSITQSCLFNLDAFFTSPATAVGFAGVQAIDEFALKVNTLHTVDAPSFDAVVGRFYRYTNQVLAAPISTYLGNEVGQARQASNLMEAIVVVVDLQLVLLALFVLFGLVARTTEAREKEVALAKLRGFGTWSVLVVGLVEPVTMLCISLPLGVLLAFVAMRIAQPLLLPGALVTIQPLVLWAAFAAFAGGLIATLFGARRILTRRLSEELRAVEPKSSSAARAALDAAALALALAGIVELLLAGVLNGRQPNPVAAFAPGLVAVAVAVMGVRVLPVAGSVVVRWTQNTTRLATGLAVRQVVRRQTSLRQITVLAVATALACFAVAGWAAAGVNRTIRADFVLGAAQVLTVEVPNGVNLENAVDRADPGGRYAMAVMLSKTPSQNLLAVQVSRLQKVAYWPSDISSTKLATIMRWLTPHLQAPLIFTGTAIRASITESGSPSPSPDLVFNVVDSGGAFGVADFGFLKPGTHVYTASLPPTCVGGCHVLQLDPLWSPSASGPQQAVYTLTLSDLQVQRAGVWQATAGRLGQPSYWQPQGGGIHVSSTTTQGVPALSLAVHDRASDTTSPEVAPAPMPQTLHGVVTQASGVSDPAAASIENFDGNSLTLDLPYRVVALPQLGYEGFLIDLTTALQAETAPPVQTVSQVWLARDAPAAVVGALRAQGLRVTQVQTPAADIISMDRGGLALAYLFFLFAAGAAAVLAIGAAVFSVFMTSRRRAFELAVLRAIGVPNRTLLRSLLGEQLLVLGPGVLLGVGAGLLGAWMALPSVPEFASTAGGPPVELVFAVLPIAAMIAVLVVLLAVAAGLASAATLRLASWDRLRTEVT